jgi:hypothetical protein
VVKLRRKNAESISERDRKVRNERRIMRHKQAITAANNAVKREKIKQKNRAKNRVAAKSRRINRRHKR